MRKWLSPKTHMSRDVDFILVPKTLRVRLGKHKDAATRVSSRPR